MKNTSEQISMLKNLLDTGSISQKEYEDMLQIALKTEESTNMNDDLTEKEDSQQAFIHQLIDDDLESSNTLNQSKVNNSNKTNSIQFGLMIILLLGLILFVTLFISNKAEASQNMRDAKAKQLSLQEEIDQKNQIIQNLEGQLEQLSELQPIFGSNLKFNNNGVGESINSNGIMCFRQSAIRYIYSSLDLQCLKAGNYKIETRIYDPFGILLQSEGYSTALSTNSQEVELTLGSNDVELDGWGSETGGTYYKGTNRVEIWCQGKLLAKSYFIVR